MDDFRADLHCHSTYSDGTCTPFELYELAKKIGLRGLSITDHDTFEGYLALCNMPQMLDFTVIPGVELSCTQEETDVHILGYSFDPDNAHFQEFCRHHREKRIERNKLILEKLKEHKMIVEEAEFMIQERDTQTFGRPHIAQVLVEKGYVKSIQEAFKKYLGEGKLCYEKGDKWPVSEGLDAIHKAGGKAVIAHPHLINRRRIIRQLLELPFDGIEVYYSRFSFTDNQVWQKIAQEKNWFMTGGSDYHGSIKPGIKLGCSYTHEESFLMLKRHFFETAPQYAKKFRDV